MWGCRINVLVMQIIPGEHIGTSGAIDIPMNMPCLWKQDVNNFWDHSCYVCAGTSTIVVKAHNLLELSICSDVIFHELSGRIKSVYTLLESNDQRKDLLYKLLTIEYVRSTLT